MTRNGVRNFNFNDSLYDLFHTVILVDRDSEP